MVNDDDEAWHAYPHHRSWFNKLDLSLRLGYQCGPCGTAPDVSGTYVIRPIYNLAGMGIGARKCIIEANDYTIVEPGYFWCEWFDGPQHSVTYEWRGYWHATSSWLGERDEDDLVRFKRWTRSSWWKHLPAMFSPLADCEMINVEFVDGNIIEVHLRPSPDPDIGDEIVPIWGDQAIPKKMIKAFDDGDGFLPVPRVGFIVS